MRVIIESDYQALSQWAANYVARESIRQNLQPKSRLFWACLPVLPLWVCIKL